jgi:hypothetical protein
MKAAYISETSAILTVYFRKHGAKAQYEININKIYIVVFCVLTPHSLVGVYQLFEITYCLHLQNQTRPIGNPTGESSQKLHDFTERLKGNIAFPGQNDLPRLRSDRGYKNQVYFLSFLI